MQLEFDTKKHVMGDLCELKHDYREGQSLRYKKGGQKCAQCYFPGGQRRKGLPQPEKAASRDVNGQVSVKTRMIPRKLIEVHKDIQPRVKINTDTLYDYKEIYLDDSSIMPPIDVFLINARYFVADGFHRRFAAKLADITELSCNVHEGTLEDAAYFAIAANQKHGLRYTNADKHKIVNRLLDMDPAAGLAANEQAKIAGVSQAFVSQIVAERAGKKD